MTLRAVNAALRVPALARLQERVDPRVHGAEVLRLGERILGQIDATLVRDHAFVE